MATQTDEVWQGIVNGWRCRREAGPVSLKKIGVTVDAFHLMGGVMGSINKTGANGVRTN